MCATFLSYFNSCYNRIRAIQVRVTSSNKHISNIIFCYSKIYLSPITMFSLLYFYVTAPTCVTKISYPASIAPIQTIPGLMITQIIFTFPTFLFTVSSIFTRRTFCKYRLINMNMFLYMKEVTVNWTVDTQLALNNVLIYLPEKYA